jgi:hypothetical protein
LFFQLKSKELLDESIELSTFNTKCLKTVGKILFLFSKCQKHCRTNPLHAGCVRNSDAVPFGQLAILLKYNKLFSRLQKGAKSAEIM